MPTALIIGQSLTFLAIIAGFGFQWVRDARQHRWEVEAREQIANRLVIANAVTAHELIDHNGRAAVVLAQQTSAANARIVAMLQAVLDKHEETS